MDLNNIKDKVPKTFELAVSYSSEDREYVNSIIQEIEGMNPSIDIFYDKDYSRELNGKDLYEYLRNIYLKQSKFVMVFFSNSYFKKQWPNLEISAIKDRLFLNFMDTTFLIVVVIDTSQSFLPVTTGFWAKDAFSVKEIAQMTLHKIKTKESRNLQYHAINDIYDLAYSLKMRFVDALNKTLKEAKIFESKTDEGFMIEIKKRSCKVVFEFQYKNIGIEALLLRYYYKDCPFKSKQTNHNVFKLGCNAYVTCEETGIFEINNLDLLKSNYDKIDGNKTIELIIKSLFIKINNNCNCISE